MKRNSLKKLWLRVMMIVAVMTTAFAGNAFADTHTLTWGPGTNTSTTTYFTATSGSNGIVSFTTDKNSSANVPYYASATHDMPSSNLLLSYASNGDGASITLSPADIKITGFVMTTYGSSNPNVEYTVDGGTPTSAPKNGTTYTVSDISVSSSLKIQNVATTSKQLRIMTIQITYETNPGVETTITIDDSGLTNTDLHAGSAAGSLSATVKDESNNVVSTPAVVWSGNNDAVATIDANTGAVTLHEGGTVTFTASYAGVWGAYGSSHATYQMTVTDSTPQTELWVETAIDDLTSSDVFVIVGTSSNKTYALPNNATDGNPPVIAVTIFDGKIEGNVPSSIQWTLSGDNTNGFTFYPNGSTTTWLYCNTTQGGTSNNNNLRVGIGSRNKFVLNSNNHLVTKDDNPARYFSVGTSYWFSYTSESSHGSLIKFYKKVAPVTVNITIGYSTLYYGDRNLIVPEGVTAYTYKVSTKLEVSSEYITGQIIPAGTAVVLKANNGSYTFELASSGGAADPNNQLRGTDKAATTTGGTYYYALSRKNGVVGLYWLTEGGGAFENGAHKAYLPLPHNFAWYAENGSSGVKGYIELPDEDDATGIETIDNGQLTMDNEIYNLAGQRLQKMQKGINIINGKKILK